mmetsp:Transcript_1671/g.5844  ORF Transcript_1671/g.5844 Transcript_1671/m.5844 type:complete len:148 (+) Transcript_1671:2611-3054(+)
MLRLSSVSFLLVSIVHCCIALLCIFAPTFTVQHMFSITVHHSYLADCFEDMVRLVGIFHLFLGFVFVLMISVDDSDARRAIILGYIAYNTASILYSSISAFVASHRWNSSFLLVHVAWNGVWAATSFFVFKREKARAIVGKQKRYLY